MENEQLPAPAASSAASTGATPSSTGSGRQPGPQISVYSGIPDRQTVQVIQQALHRQPNTAAQYLQQMYAAQQQHLMLQTAALQQQHLTSAQLQSLAAVQQASLAANRQSGPSGGSGPPPPAQQPTINLAAAPAAAQLINRAQSVNSAAASGIAQQAVLLGNAASPALTASQAQMYLRAQMLIFTPTATVTAVRPESPAAPAAPPPASAAQVQNLALRPTAAAAPAGPHLPALAMKPPGPPKPAAPKAGQPEPPADHLKKGDAADARAHPLARATPAAHPLIAPAYAQLQPHQFLQQQQKQIQHQFVIQQQQLAPRGQPQLIQGGSSPAPQLQPLPSPGPNLAPQPGPLQSAGGGQQKTGAGPQTVAGPGPAGSGSAPSAEVSAPNGPGGCSNHGAQRKFQHASAVILQLQPAAGTPPQLGLAEGSRKDPPAAESPPAAPRQPAALSPPPGALDEPQGDRLGAHETGPERVHAQPAAAGPGMTSGTGSSASTVAAAPHNGENKPPQAIVKPQILTHVIEGFVIQEGAEPFPVGRSSLLVGSLKQKYAQELLAEKLPPPDNATTTTTTTDSDMEEPYAQESKEEGNPPKLKCELCGRVDFAYKFKRSKRFCSMACAKRYNVGCTKRVGLFHPDRSKLQKPGGPPHGRRRTCKATLPALSKDTKKQSPVSLPTGSVPLSVTTSLQLNHSQEDSSRCSDNSSYEEPLSPISASSSTSRRRQGDRDLELRDMELPDMHMRDLAGIGHRFLPSEPSKWNVEDVYEFIRSLPGCQEIAEEFRAQEIDGQALLLLKEDHLMSTMNIKLGPALKIYARISMLKDS
ncbi:polyhomeotic-like protein 2 isoform X2 [Struthio camelus]|uniref:polyhomeotic-like protein 2 isoform X2 n=1 Tax=Struthio camelus TaxID=8801 RepID=UPI003603CA9B